LENSNFDQLSNLLSEFEALHAYSVNSSLAGNIPEDVEALHAYPANSSQAGNIPEDVLQPSSFWTTLSSNMDVGHYMNNRYSCEFEEHTNEKGTLIKSRPQADSEKLHWQDAHHFVSETYVAKVYRLLLDPPRGTSSKEFISKLSKALHECAATAFLCDKKDWFLEVCASSKCAGGLGDVDCMLLAHSRKANLSPLSEVIWHLKPKGVASVGNGRGTKFSSWNTQVWNIWVLWQTRRRGLAATTRGTLVTVTAPMRCICERSGTSLRGRKYWRRMGADTVLSSKNASPV
jgi:hypothetical protein